MPRRSVAPPHHISLESVSVVLDGENYTVKAEDPNYEKARKAAFEGRWEDIPPLLSAGLKLVDWAKGDFLLRDNHLFYRDRQVPDELYQSMLAMADAGDTPTPIMRYWELLSENPSYRAVKMLWPFLRQHGICIDEDGFLLCYKAVDKDYMSFHADENDNHVDNSPGKKPWMPRNLVSDEYDSPCHTGFHAGNLPYAQSFSRGFGRGHRMVIVRINPKDVVCVCKSSYKIRVNTYEVLGDYVEKLPDTVYSVAKGQLIQNQPAKKAGRKPVAAAAGSFASKLKPQRGTVKPKGDGKKRKGDPDPDRYNVLSTVSDADLWKENMATLRKYGTRVVKLAGCTKLRKEALVPALIEARNRR